MTDQQKLQAEKNELNLLLDNGVNIEVERTILKKKQGIAGFFGKRYKLTEKLTYTIKEPTLSTLDRLAAEQIDLVMDEASMSTGSAIQEAKKMSKEYCMKLAKIIAIAVIGQDYVISYQDKNRTSYEFDNKKLAELTQIFYENVKPSRLLQYVILINTMSNFGDFMNSIRLMSASRTTMPILVEQKD